MTVSESPDRTPEVGVAPNRLSIVEKAVESWKRQLVDMTARNRLLYYRELKVGTLDLTSVDVQAAQELKAGNSVRLSALVGPDKEAVVAAAKRVRAIRHKGLENFEERGISTLFLALGLATWKSSLSASPPAAPVLLARLEVTAHGVGQADFNLVMLEKFELNETFLIFAETEFGVSLDADEILGLGDEDDAGSVDVDAVFERLADCLTSVPDFSIRKAMIVGNFMYQRMPMVNDISKNVEALAKHDLISAIAGVEEARRAIRDADARDTTEMSLPNHIEPQDEFLILDADATQNFAINRALAGRSLIIEGPPGTGKSQTIANLIGALAAKGKHVLFVAEKRAAIDAVRKRIDEADLGDIILDLHGGVGSRKKMAMSFADTLQGYSEAPHTDASSSHSTLCESRSILNAYEQAIHEAREPWGCSVWNLNNTISTYDVDEQLLHFSDTYLKELSQERIDVAATRLRLWLDLRERNEGFPAWSAGSITTWDQAIRATEIVQELLSESIPDLHQAISGILADIGMSDDGWTFAKWRNTFEMLGRVGQIADIVTDEFWKENLSELHSALSSATGITRLFAKRYRAAKRRVRGLMAPRTRRRPELVVDGIAVAEEWAAAGFSGLPRCPVDSANAQTAFERVGEQLSELAGFVALSRSLDEFDVVSLNEWLGLLASSREDAFTRAKLVQERTFLLGERLGSLVEAVEEGRVEPRRAEGFLRANVATAIRTHISANDSRLSGFSGSAHDKNVARFAAADREHIEGTPQRVWRAIANYVDAEREAHPDQGRLIVEQARRKSKHKSLRELLAQAPDLVIALKPCWVMSPLVVAQALPPRQVFDVVIFDEASQIRPEEAISALLRAPQAIIAGDPLQLPPTRFFDAEDDSMEEDEGDTAETTGFESILNVVGSLLRPTMLTWHYRSEDERLIAFSNHNIYHSSLTTFPGSRKKSPLVFHKVDYTPRTKEEIRSNPEEVNAVIQLMIDHARNRTHESLGVIAMGQHHASNIESALYARLDQEQDHQLAEFFDESSRERAFVKNIERVQGDERDAIILAIGYGKAPDGSLPYRFGPINHEGGERRLNVAMSRARRRMDVVASFADSDMDDSRSSAKGVMLLRRLLKFAASGGHDLSGADHQMPLNPFELFVMRRMESAGLNPIAQYGASKYRIDFVLPHQQDPDRLVLAVEADGASYHSSKTARDRDRLRQQKLESLGWRFHRIWSTDWFRNPDTEIEKLLAAYDEASLYSTSLGEE